MKQSAKVCLATVAALLCATIHATAWAAANYKTEVVADNLDHPWSVAFLPDGALLVTELSGALRVIDQDGVVSPPVSGVPPVFFAGQGGLFDVLPDPDYADNQIIYLSYAAGDNEVNSTTVARGRLQRTPGQGTLVDVAAVFTASPGKYAPLHYGGRMAWLPDGTLLLTTGDGFDFREQAQDLGTHFGKTIALQPSGTPVAAPPFPQNPLVFSYGHRNPQGLAVASDGTIYLHEHGPQGGDEVNILQPGHNYGWPAVTFGMDYNGAYVSPFTEHPGMTQPVHVWVPSIAPSGLAVYEGDMFPEWRGNLLVGALVDQEVRRLELSGQQVVTEEALFSELGRRVRDVRVAPDGSIYVILDGSEGQIVRVSR